MEETEERKKITVGDLVVLASGGPVMTVMKLMHSYTYKGDAASCNWFANGEYKSKDFPLATLRKAETEQ
jgi:uncharacterized protein YodC (DUF2158 family)